VALTPLTRVQQATVLALVEARRLDAVSADIAGATSFLRQAEERLDQLPLLTSVVVRYGIAYDACHDTGEALRAAYGFRTTNGPGQHEALGRYLRAVFDKPLRIGRRGSSTGSGVLATRTATKRSRWVSPQEGRAMNTILTSLLSQPAWVVYAAVAMVILLEGAFPAGMVLPGEATAVLGGATVALGRSELLPMVLVVVVAATLGDGIGFRVGAVTGTRVLQSRILRSRRGRVIRLQDGLAGRGAAALVAARWTAFVRSIVPALAGASGMPYRRFAPWNVLGALTWGTTTVVLGAAAGRSYAEMQTWLGGAGAALLLAAVAVVALAALQRRRAGAAAAAPAAAPAPADDVACVA